MLMAVNNGADAPQPLRVVETEAALLGALMIDNRLFDRVADVVTEDDFAEPLHARLYGLIAHEVGAGRLANPITLRPHLEHDPAIVELGGVGYLGRLTGSGAGLIGARDFANQIAAFGRRRRLYAATLTLADRLTTDLDTPVEALVDEIDAAMATALKRKATELSMTGAQAFDATMAEIEAEAAGDRPPGIHVEGFDDWNQLTGTMRKGEVVILAGRPSMGKAQPLDAPVLTPTGWTFMGALRVGDALASIDGQPSTVTAIFPQGQKQIYCVTFSDGRSAEACGEHLWSVMYRDWDVPRVVSTEKLQEMLARKRYAKRLWIEQFDGQFGGGELPIDPWLLGFLLGDGSICGTAVRFSTADASIVEVVAARLPDGLTVSSVGGCDYRISGRRAGNNTNAIMEALRELKVFDTRSHDKFIPPIYLRADRAARMALLQGLMDSDGWAETFAAVRFSTASVQLANDMQYLVRSLGGLCSIRTRSTSYTYKGERKVGKLSHTCRIRFTDAAQIFTLERKAARCGRAHSSARLTVASIEPTRIAEAQCISVSHPSRLYVTENFVVTHNTAVGLCTALGCARGGNGTVFVSLEMSVKELMKRAITDLIYDYGTSASFSNVQRGKFTAFDRERLADARRQLDAMPIIIRQDAGLKVGRLAMMIRRYKRQMAAREQSLDVVFIDYLGLVRADGTKTKRYEEMGEVSRTIKEIARELDVCIVLLAQLNREVEKRDDKRPQLSDLRDSGEIEQDADVVLFVYREQYYLERSEPPEGDKKRPDWELACEAARDRVELIAAKVRNGRVGHRKCYFFAAHQAVRGSNFHSSARL